MSFDSQEAIKYYNNFKKKNVFFEIKKNQNKKTYWTLFVLEDQLRNECVPYHETKKAIPEFKFLGWPLTA